MTDGVELNPGSGGKTISTDDVSDGGVADGQHVQRMKAGFGEDGGYGDVAVGNPLPVSADLRDLALIANGDIANYGSIQKFGLNPDSDAAAIEDVWDGGGTYSFPASVQSVEILSSDAADDSAGTGARTVQVYGLNASYVEQNETVTLDGTTPVNLTNQYLRIYRMIVRSAGPGGENAGTLTCRPQGGGTTIAQINAGNNQTKMAIYTVPAGKTGFLFSVFCSSNNANTSGYAAFELSVRQENEVFAVKYDVALASDGTTANERHFSFPIVIPAKSDIKITATSTANNTITIAGFEVMLKG